MPRGVTPISRDLYDLHMIEFWRCVVIAGLVFSAMAWSIVFHRKPRGAIAANFHESTLVEMIWTIGPLLILIVVAIPATATLLKLEDAKTDADINLEVIGIQWKWQYNYIDEGVQFARAKQ